MGAYLSEPLTQKESTDESNAKLGFGASSMQGWRVSQEDSHNSILDFDTNAALFAVYDGHGGAEVAKYCEMKMPQFIKDTAAYKEGKYSEALEEAFLNIDATISTPEVIELLKTLSDNQDSTIDPDETIDDKEEVSDLWQEASMPLDKIIAKYQEAQANPLLNKLKKEGSENPLSPCLRSKRPGSSGESSGAGCSSKLAYNDECEVSSSMKDNEDEVKASESQVTTTNGETKTTEKGEGDKIEIKDESSSKSSAQISGSGDSVVAPDTSADSKANSSSTSNDVKEKAKVNGEVTDSMAGSKEDATSSSQENGEVQSPSKKGKSIAKPPSATSSESNAPEQSSQPKRIRRAAAKLYNSMLGLIQAQNEEDEDESDSNDETFQGKEETSTDEEGEEGEVVNGIGDSSEEDVEEEDTTDEDEDDEMDAFNMAIKNEPGSNSGCTAVVALLKDNELYVANAGDSRCVVCRDGKAVDMSIDHKPEDELEFERITKAGGKVSSDGRVNGGLNLSRAIGDLGYKQNEELGPKEQMITALPDIKTLTIDSNTDEFMVLACDGIWNSMTSQEVVDFVKCRLNKGVEKLSAICEEMFDHCLAPNTAGDGTGCDNMTAVIVKFKSSTKKRAKDDEEETSQAKRSKTEDNSASVTSSE